jgi:A/G-specific adenine glycosylase
MTLALDKNFPSAVKRAGTEPPSALALLAWYDASRRAFPWRALPGQRMEPYKVWLSEIMLQQTRVETVERYFVRFLHRFPTVDALATARLDSVLKLWAGLGYYARARNLHACAREVVSRFAGKFPDTEEQLRTLPGIGVYTAAAIAAIAFDRQASPVDGNIERVVARLFAVEAPLPRAKPELAALAATLTPGHRAGDFAQAMMDLGATVCTPKQPDCPRCPYMFACKAYRAGLAESFPRKAAKAEGRLRKGAAFFVQRADGAVLLRKRPLKGLLGGMTEVPGTEWAADFDWSNALQFAPGISPSRPLRGEGRGEGPSQVKNWKRLPGRVRHVFTHFPLELTVYAAAAPKAFRAPEGMRFVPRSKLQTEAMPTLMRNVIAHALEKTANRASS